MWLVGISTVSGDLPFRLSNGEFVVGRAKNAQIVIAESTVSRRHARITVANKSLVVQDLESSNGTFLNEIPVTRGPLALGDHVRFGSVACAILQTPIPMSRIGDDESTYQIPLLKPSDDTTLSNVFTAAQQAVIPLLMDGRSEPEIATTLGKSPHTIHAQIRAIFERAGVHSREELIVKLLKS